MRREILMPRLSDAVEEGVLVTWFVEPGATVTEGDLIAEIQVEKVSAEVRAPAAGRVAELLAEPGAVVPQGAVLAVIETGAADVAAAEGRSTAGASSAAVSPSADAAYPPAAATAAPTGSASASAPRTAASPASPGAVSPAAAPVAPASPSAAPVAPASPAARRLARELGVDLALLTGSGPGGRIVEADVRAAAVPSGGSTAGATAPPAPLSLTRRRIADRLRTGLLATAQVTLTAEADLTELAARLATWSTAWGRRATYTEAIVRACALALRAHPRLSAWLTPDGLVTPDRIDVGVAVAVEDALLVPVVRDADRRPLAEIGAAIETLAERARRGQLEAREMEGACFSVTNLGAHRVDAFTPLLDPPQTAILGVGRARPRPVVVEGALAVRTIAVLSLTFDHQVVDGAPAAAFLDAVLDLLEDPDRLSAP
jgi:pyruvate dehydrogenase E2 component (dihydrolipoamide acetyltransferase)